MATNERKIFTMTDDEAVALVTHTYLHGKMEQVRDITESQMKSRRISCERAEARLDERMGILEKDNKGMNKDIAAIRVIVADLSGQFKTWFVVGGFVMSILMFLLNKIG